ncbi:MAG: ComEC/Rec2 family competence protein, partial [Pseudomonadota bacterium]
MLADREVGQPAGFVWMAGWVAGAALQLQQAALWPVGIYVALALGPVGMAFVWRRWRVAMRSGLPAALVLVLWLALGMAFGVGLTGWRAAVYAGETLDPALEGRDMVVTGVVAQMPQLDEGGVRFRLDVETARSAGDDLLPNGRPVALPPRLALAWYATNSGLWARAGDDGLPTAAAPGPVHAGERWRVTVRLKAPHGNLNPHGFDQELSLWEQGVQATGYVRSGAHDTPPLRVAMTWWHPVERAREAVRDAVFERVADRRQAGVIAALVTGDQSAIERADWDVFRATGVAHLMSISGLHVTMFAWLAGLAV